MRCALSIEPQAAAYRIERRDRRRSRALQKQASSHSTPPRTATWPTWPVRNRGFHIALVEPGRCSLTTDLVERLAVLAERYVIAHLEPAGRDARAHVEHQALFNAWLERDKRKVEKLLKEHIQGTLQDLRAQLEDTD